MRPPKENGTKFILWLLTVAAYGLTSTNAKWQNHSNNMMIECDMAQLPFVPQLFYRLGDTGLVDELAVKLVDDVIFGGSEDVRAELVEKMKGYFDIGTISHTPGKMFFLWALITQYDDGTIKLSADENVSELVPNPISSILRKESDSPVTSIKLTNYRSVNGMLSWLGMLISPLSGIQQQLFTTKVTFGNCERLTFSSESS